MERKRGGENSRGGDRGVEMKGKGRREKRGVGRAIGAGERVNI